MKFAAALTLAASASAASLQKRQAQSYPIGNFTADCIPHSVMCAYNFTISTEPYFPVDNCGAFLQGPDVLPNVTEGDCPSNVAFTWSATKTTNGSLNFAIWYPFNSRSNITYCHTIPASDIITENNGAVSTQHYRGPSNFTATVGDCFA